MPHVPFCLQHGAASIRVRAGWLFAGLFFYLVGTTTFTVGSQCPTLTSHSASHLAHKPV